MHALGVFSLQTAKTDINGCCLRTAALLYNWLNSDEKWRQTLKTPLQPFWLNNRGRNTTHLQCIFSIHNTVGFTPLQYNIMHLVWLHLRLLKKERLCASVFLWVRMSTLTVLARNQGHSDSPDCTQRSGEIGVDKNVSYATMETCLLHSNGATLLSTCGTVQSYRVERRSKQSVGPWVSQT